MKSFNREVSDDRLMTSQPDDLINVKLPSCFGRDVERRGKTQLRLKLPVAVYKVTLLLLDVYDRSNDVFTLCPKRGKSLLLCFKLMVLKQL